MLKGLIEEKEDQNHEQQNGKKIQIYEQLNLKNKLSIQEQRQNHGCGERFDGCHMGGECEAMGDEVRGLRSTKVQTVVTE